MRAGFGGATGGERQRAAGQREPRLIGRELLGAEVIGLGRDPVFVAGVEFAALKIEFRLGRSGGDLGVEPCERILNLRVRLAIAADEGDEDEGEGGTDHAPS